MSKINAFHNEIVERLKTIKEIKEVHYAYIDVAKKYPAACVKFLGMDADYEENISDRRSYRYEISIRNLIQDGDDRNVAYSHLETVLDETIEKFNRFNNKINKATFTRPIVGAVYEEIQDEQEMIIASFEIDIDNVERV